jgi:hypothetical protein
MAQPRAFAAGNEKRNRKVSQSKSGMEQAPGPRGSPQVPQAPVEGAGLEEAFPATANTESWGVSFWL